MWETAVKWHGLSLFHCQHAKAILSCLYIFKMEIFWWESTTIKFNRETWEVVLKSSSKSPTTEDKMWKWTEKKSVLVLSIFVFCFILFSHPLCCRFDCEELENSKSTSTKSLSTVRNWCFHIFCSLEKELPQPAAFLLVSDRVRLFTGCFCFRAIKC
jgi:hypothetical protein